MNPRKDLILLTLVKDKHYRPTYRDLMKAICVKSVSTVEYYINQLEQDGYVIRHKSPRWTEITEKGKNYLGQNRLI